MANRIPLIINSGSGQIQELAAGDNLSLPSSDIVGVGNVTAVGNVQGTYILGNGALLTGVSTTSSNINNGTSNVTIGTSGGNVTIGVAGTGNVAVIASNNITVAANIVPAANITYDLGTTSQRFKDLYLSNSTIYLGNATISANATAIVMTNPAGGQTVLAGASGNTAITATTVSASGNITGSYFLGNGSQLTGLPAT